jgi:hypothetical protein
VVSDAAPAPRRHDSVTLTADRLPGDKFKVRSGTSSIDTVILADQVLELRIRGSQIHTAVSIAATNLLRPRTPNIWIISLFDMFGIARNAILVSNPSLDFHLMPSV